MELSMNNTGERVGTFGREDINEGREGSRAKSRSSGRYTWRLPSVGRTVESPEGARLGKTRTW